MKKIALVLMVVFLAMTTVQAQEKPVEKKEAKTMAGKCEQKKGEKCSKCEEKCKEAKKSCSEKPCETGKKAEKKQ
jgi:hypothetical protein